MNMSFTESDKKLIGFLAAFLVAVLFWGLVFKPLTAKNRQLEEDVQQAIEQEQAQEDKASKAEKMVNREAGTREQLAKVLARFYPMLQSQDAENMATTLALNHNLTIQSLTVTMPEAEIEPMWYQYAGSEDSANEQTQSETEGQKALEGLSLHVARVTCVTEGEEEDLWAMLDDISANYPAISVMNVEWSVVEMPVSVTLPAESYISFEEEDENSEQGVSEVRTVTETVKTNRMTVTMEIYMCKQ